VRATLDEPGVAGGAFRLRIDAPGRSLRIIERAVDIRSRVFQMPYGDQGIQPICQSKTIAARQPNKGNVTASKMAILSTNGG